MVFDRRLFWSRAIRIDARITPETSLQVHLRNTSRPTFRVNPSESLILDLEVTTRIAWTLDTEISHGNAVDSALGFSARDPPRFAIRLTLGTTSSSRFSRWFPEGRF